MLVFSTVEEKWLVFAGLEILDAANIDSVVSGRVDIYNLDDEVRYRTVQERRPGAAYEADIRVSRRPSSKVVAQRALIFREHAYAVEPGSRENPVHVGAIVQYDQYKRWIERNGHKRICRHAMRFPVLQSGDDGDTRREQPQRIPKLTQVENLSCHGKLASCEGSVSGSNLPMPGFDFPMMLTS